MRILIVDDQAAQAELAAEAFARVDCDSQVTILNDGRRVLSYLRREEPRHDEDLPDLILLDLHMPHLSGLELLSALKADEELRQIPVIVLSSSEAEEDIEYVYRHFGNCYVVKPVDMDGMYQLVEALKHFWCERVSFSRVTRARVR